MEQGFKDNSNTYFRDEGSYTMGCTCCPSIITTLSLPSAQSWTTNEEDLV